MPARLRQVMVSRGRASGIAPAQRLPLVLVAVAPPRDLEGPEPTEVVGAFAEPTAVLAAVNRLLQPPGQAVSAAATGTEGRCRHGAGPRPPTGSSAAHRTTARLRRWRSCSCSPGS